MFNKTLFATGETAGPRAPLLRSQIALRVQPAEGRSSRGTLFRKILIANRGENAAGGVSAKSTRLARAAGCN